MFHEIREPIIARMRFLEDSDARDRADGTPHQRRLRQISAEVGRFLAILAAGSPQGSCIEIGTSAGYSALWLGLACEARGIPLTTFEVSAEKVQLARETIRLAGFQETITVIEGDARHFLSGTKSIGFCFLDADKEVYAECYELVVPALVPGGLLVADNAMSHREVLGPMLKWALNDRRVDAMIVPIGKGVLMCRAPVA